jgi:hypothetical protein
MKVGLEDQVWDENKRLFTFPKGYKKGYFGVFSIYSVIFCYNYYLKKCIEAIYDF